MERKLLVGANGIAAKDIETSNGTIKKGTKVKIVDVGMFGYDLIVKDSYRIVEGSFDSVIITEQ
jgi:hypothetical protein